MDPLRPREVTILLDSLCVNLGFCLDRDAHERLQNEPPSDVEAFTVAVFEAEGLQPETAGRHLYRQVRAMVEAAFLHSVRTRELAELRGWLATLSVLELLVAGRYDDIVALSRGRHLSADELRRAVVEHGRRLRVPPSPSAGRFDMIAVRRMGPQSWSVQCDLWTEEAGLGDLTLVLTLTEAGDDGFEVEVDDLRKR